MVTGLRVTLFMARGYVSDRTISRIKQSSYFIFHFYDFRRFGLKYLLKFENFTAIYIFILLIYFAFHYFGNISPTHIGSGTAWLWGAAAARVADRFLR